MTPALEDIRTRLLYKIPTKSPFEYGFQVKEEENKEYLEGVHTRTVYRVDFTFGHRMAVDSREGVQDYHKEQVLKGLIDYMYGDIKRELIPLMYEVMCETGDPEIEKAFKRILDKMEMDK